MVNNHLVVAHRVLVKFVASASAADRAELRQTYTGAGLVPVGSHGWYKLDAPDKTTAQLLAEIAAIDTVARVVPDAVVQATATPNDPGYVDGDQWAPGRINAPEAWNYTTGSRSFAVADFDSGVDAGHPDLAANMWSAPWAFTITVGGNTYNCPEGAYGFSALADDAGCTGQEADGAGHGTNTAGVIGAVGNNGIDVAGINWTVSLVSIRVMNSLEQSTDSEIADGIDAAEQIAQQFPDFNLWVGNMSLGETSPLPATYDEMASDTGMLFAIATGNNCSSSPLYPAAYHTANEIAVSASDQSDERSKWEGGQCSDGGGDMAAPGSAIYTTDIRYGAAYIGGTSFAAPQVSGAAALFSSVCPLPIANTITALEANADEIPALTSIATDGRRLDVGAAVQQCATGPKSTAIVRLSAVKSAKPDYGTISVVVAGDTSTISYNTNEGTQAVDEELAEVISDSPYVTAAVTELGQITITTIAGGPYSILSISGSVDDQCPADQCGRPPSFTYTDFSQ